MSDTPQTPEAVAYLLMTDLLRADGKEMKKGEHKPLATRQEIISTYKEALELVSLKQK